MKETATLLLLDRESIPIIRFQNDLQQFTVFGPF